MPLTIRYVPADGSELASLLHEGVQEAQPEQQRLEGGGLPAACKERRARRGNGELQRRPPVRAGFVRVAARRTWQGYRHAFAMPPRQLLAPLLYGPPSKKLLFAMGSRAYDRRRLARRPAGGSLVILTLPCSGTTHQKHARHGGFRHSPRHKMLQCCIRMQLSSTALQQSCNSPSPTRLQYGHGEGGAGHGRHPQPEVWVRVVWLDGLADLLQAGHPAGSKVAVLQQHPPAGRHIQDTA